MSFKNDDIDGAFNIQYSISELIVVVTLLCFVETGFVFGYFSDIIVRKTLYIIFITPFTFIMIISIVSGILFKIQVSKDAFSVRTRTGKKFSFTCNDIWKISCSKAGTLSKYGPSYFINIYTRKNKTIVVRHNMVGFKKLAKYLLSQVSEGNIRKFAISDSCQKELMRYANGDIFSKRKKKIKIGDDYE